ncbi:hypothetical protein G6011_03586 [Alternaria panax]|uniref:Uncharacterized protein n=1 Tax=Alternaria panax TaxID=48097 RepID=A0AAD4NRA5_9PLEO|nr:hypothetical protein G6011_03586 [Alternaria panax]
MASFPPDPEPQWFITNHDPSRSHLNSPVGERSQQTEFQRRQAIDLVTLRTPTLQRPVTLLSLTTVTQQRPNWPPASTQSIILDVNGDAVSRPNDQESDLTSYFDDSNLVNGSVTPNVVHDSLVPRVLSIHKRPPPVPQKSQSLAGNTSATQPQPPLLPLSSRNPMSRYMADTQAEPAKWLQEPIQFPVQTQGPAPDSTENRRSQFPQIDRNLANVSPGERAIDHFNSRSMAGYSRMVVVGNPATVEALRSQYDQTHARVPPERPVRHNSDVVARTREKEKQKVLRDRV